MINYNGLKKLKVKDLRDWIEISSPDLITWSKKAKKLELVNAITDEINFFLADTNSTTVEEPNKPIEIKPCKVDGLINPHVDKTFSIPRTMKEVFATLIELGDSYYPPNVLMKGPQGCGKTETALQFAAISGLPLLKINCALVREARDWFGYKTAENGSVSWIRSQFAQAVEQGGVVILLDEITRVSPPVLNSLLPLLDGTKQSFVEEIKEVLHVGKHTYFFATANIGAQFVGAYSKIDAALLDRFPIKINCDYLAPKEETELLIKRTGINRIDAELLVKVATQVRNHNKSGGQLTENISTRNLLDTAVLFGKLGTLAFNYTILPMFSDDGGSSERTQVLQILQAQFGSRLVLS
jgi:hypothetical protein